MEVEDSGIGIETNELQSLGNIFSVGKDNNKKTSGFGLCVSNTMANFLGNDQNIDYGIHVCTEALKGSKFWFYVENIDNVYNVISEESSFRINNVYDFNLNEGFEEKVPNNVPNEKICKINMELKNESIKNVNLDCPFALIVDDNIFNLLVLKSMLTNLNLTVEEAHNGQEAIDKVENILLLSKDATQFRNKFGVYKIIFMDIDMPIKNGYQATTEILELCKNSNLDIPIIAVSAFEIKEEKHKALEFGMKDYLQKPVSKNEVVLSLKKYCQFEQTIH